MGEKETGAAACRGGLPFWAGLGLLWSIATGLMNAEVFAFPGPGTGADVLFIASLIAECAASAALVASRRLRLFAGSLAGWVRATCLAVGLLLLYLGDIPWVRMAGAVVSGVCIAACFALWVRRLALRPAGCAVVDAVGGFCAANIFALLCLVVGNGASSYFFVAAAYLSEWLGQNAEKGICAVESRSDLDKDGAPTGARGLKGTPFAALLSLFSLSTISIATSYVVLSDRMLPLDGQLFFHVLAPSLGVLLAWLLRHSFNKKASAAVVAVPLTATLLLLLPALGSPYAVVFKFYAMAVVECVIVQALVQCIDGSQRGTYGPVVVGGQLFCVIAGSSLLGNGIAALGKQTMAGEGSFFVYLGILFIYLLLATLALLFFVGPKTRHPVVEVALPDAVGKGPHDSMVRECGLTPRETQVLALLAEGRSATYIAQELSLSADTVKGHVRHVYQKLDVHSKQELIDLVRGLG